MKHPSGERYRLELVALADHDAPAVVRLRRLLKTLLRGYRFRCRSVEQLPAAPPPIAQAAAGDVEATSGPPAGADAS